MKTKWLIILIIVFIVAIFFSLLLNQIGTKMLPSLEKVTSPAAERTPLLSDRQQEYSPVLPAVSPVQINRSVTIIKRPVLAEDYSAQSRQEAAASTPPVSAPGNPSASSAAVSAEAEQKSGVTKEGREASPVEIARIKAKGIIIQ